MNAKQNTQGMNCCKQFSNPTTNNNLGAHQSLDVYATATNELEQKQIKNYRKRKRTICLQQFKLYAFSITYKKKITAVSLLDFEKLPH